MGRVAHQAHREDAETRGRHGARPRAKAAPCGIRRVDELEIGQIVGQRVACSKAGPAVAGDVPRQSGARPEVVAGIVELIYSLTDTHKLPEARDEFRLDVV